MAPQNSFFISAPHIVWKKSSVTATMVRRRAHYGIQFESTHDTLIHVSFVFLVFFSIFICSLIFEDMFSRGNHFQQKLSYEMVDITNQSDTQIST
jgi:hypothetical protein